MAHFNYTVTTKKCPQCGQILEQKNDAWRTIFFIVFFPIFVIYLVYLISYSILSEILGVYVPEVGEPYIICPKCKTKISSGKKTYKQLNATEKVYYDNRGLFRTAYFFGGTMIISLLLIFLKLSKNPTDRVWGTAGIYSAIICFAIVMFIIIYWARKDIPKENKPANTDQPAHKVSNYSKTSVAEPTKAISCTPICRNENLSDIINIDDINFDFTHDDIKNIQQDLNTHRKDCLPELFNRCKQDNEAMKDMAKTFIYMYSRNDNLLIAKKDNGLPIVNTAFGRYLPIYTEEKFFNNLVGNQYVERGTKDIFEMFYLFNECNKCEGIVFNYGTDNMILLPKITIDNIGFDLIFDVPWKK